MSNLTETLRALLVKHDLRSIRLEVSNFSEDIQAAIFWKDDSAEHGLGLVFGHHATDAALALAKGIEAANAARITAPVVELPDIESDQ